MPNKLRFRAHSACNIHSFWQPEKLKITRNGSLYETV